MSEPPNKTHSEHQLPSLQPRPLLPPWPPWLLGLTLTVSPKTQVCASISLPFLHKGGPAGQLLPFAFLGINECLPLAMQTRRPAHGPPPSAWGMPLPPQVSGTQRLACIPCFCCAISGAGPWGRRCCAPGSSPSIAPSLRAGRPGTSSSWPTCKRGPDPQRRTHRQQGQPGLWPLQHSATSGWVPGRGNSVMETGIIRTRAET